MCLLGNLEHISQIYPPHYSTDLISLQIPALLANQTRYPLWKVSTLVSASAALSCHRLNGSPSDTSENECLAWGMASLWLSVPLSMVWFFSIIITLESVAIDWFF